MDEGYSISAMVEAKARARELTKQTGILHVVEYDGDMLMITESSRLECADGELLKIGDFVLFDNLMPVWVVVDVQELSCDVIEVHLRTPKGDAKTRRMVESCKGFRHYTKEG